MKSAPAIRAVLFDLYDTLIFRPPGVDHQAYLRMAEAAGVPFEAFIQAWRQGRERRMRYPTSLSKEFRTALADLGVENSDDVVPRLIEIQLSTLREHTRAYPTAHSTLVELKRRGYQLGLVTNCSSWAAEPIDFLDLRSAFDAIVLSYEARVLKPDLRIYLMACEVLAVPPEACAFVADGGFGELDAAHQLGMLAIRVAQDYQSSDYGSSDYHDFQVANVAEVVTLLSA